MLGGDLGAETTQNPNAKLQIKASHTVHGLLTHNSPNCSVLERKRKMRMSVTCRTGQGGICQEGRRLPLVVGLGLALVLSDWLE